MEALTLFELNEHIRRVIALNFQESLWVRCEISQVKESRGHYYLDLVEKVSDSTEIRAQIQGVIWAKSAWVIQRKLKDTFTSLLQDGMEVRIKVRIDFHERYGLKLSVEDIDPTFTLGHLEAKRRETIVMLQTQGLIGLNSKLPIPMVMQRIAILSTQQAAGYQDFHKHLLHNVWQFRFWPDLYPIAVQGAMVETQLLDALERIARVQHHYDCVVIIRGGGSRMDLSAFDSPEIGKAIARFPLPVFTGIGHEIDTTVADAVAHTALKTPTAVADFIIEINARYDTTVRHLFGQITDLVRRKSDSYQAEINHLKQLLRRVPAERISRQRLLLSQMHPALVQACRQFLRVHHDRLQHAQSMTETLDPTSILKRGFSMTTMNGRRIRSVGGLAPGQQITTHLSDGTIDSTIISHEQTN